MIGKEDAWKETRILNPRITLIDGRVMTTSLVVAEHFGKQQGDVLKAIRNALDVAREFHLRNFAEVFRSVPSKFNGHNFAPMIRPVTVGNGAPRHRLGSS